MFYLVKIPIHIDWLIGVFQRDKFYDWYLNIGLAYTQLIGYYTEDFSGKDISDLVIYDNKSATLLQAGTTYRFSPHFGLNLKASLPIGVSRLDWTLAARLVYII
jgi:hypothetical protein